MATQTVTPTVPRSVSALVSAILRTPLLHRVVSGGTMLLTVTGRKTRRTYTFPVSYLRDGDVLSCYTDHGWWRNLVGGAPVSMLVGRRRLHGQGEVVSQDEATAIQTLREFFARTPRDARYHGVRRTPTGEFDADDLTRAAGRSVLVRIRIDSTA